MSYDLTVDASGASIVVMADPGVGKTTQVAAAAQDSLYIASDDTTLRAYLSGLRALNDPSQAALVPPAIRALLAGKRPPKDVKVIRRQHQRPDGTYISNDYAVRIIVDWFVKGGYKEFPGGIVFDEWNEFLDRIQIEYETAAKNGNALFLGRGGKPNFWAVLQELDRLTQLVLQIPKLVPTKLYLVTHMRAPTYFEEGASAGLVKYKGGPKAPGGNISRNIGANATVLVELAAVNPDAVRHVDPGTGMETVEKVDPKTSQAKRVWITSANAEWDRKWRDFRIPQGVINADEYPLERLLRMTDFL